MANPYLEVGVRFLVGYRRTGSEGGAGDGFTLGEELGVSGGTTLGGEAGRRFEGEGRVGGISTLGVGNGMDRTGVLGGIRGRCNEGGVGGGGGKGGIGGNTGTGNDGGGIELVLAPQSRAVQSLGPTLAGAGRGGGCVDVVALFRSFAMSM